MEYFAHSEHCNTLTNVILRHCTTLSYCIVNEQQILKAITFLGRVDNNQKIFYFSKWYSFLPFYFSLITCNLLFQCNVLFLFSAMYFGSSKRSGKSAHQLSSSILVGQLQQVPRMGMRLARWCRMPQLFACHEAEMKNPMKKHYPRHTKYKENSHAETIRH